MLKIILALMLGGCVGFMVCAIFTVGKRADESKYCPRNHNYPAPEPPPSVIQGTNRPWCIACNKPVSADWDTMYSTRR